MARDSIFKIMDAHPNFKKSNFSTPFLKIYHEKKTGVVTVKSDRVTIKIYLDNGLLVYAEGLDTDRTLIRKIAARKGLGQNQLNKLIKLRESNPHLLGKTLIESGLISRSAWDKFLILSVRYHLTTALQMDEADLEFTESGLHISPINSVNRDFIELLIDTIRGIKDKAFFKKFVPGPQACFQRTANKGDLEAQISLISTEQTLLSIIDGQRTVEDISSSTGIGQEDLYQVFYLLLFLEFIAPAQEKGEEKGGVDYGETINLYLDFFRILETNFKSEVGREFEAVLEQCMKELAGQKVELFQGIDLRAEPHEKIASKIHDRFSSLLASGENPLILSTSFNKLLYLLIMRMKKVLGDRITEDTINEMLNMVSYVQKYKQDAEMINYMRRNLEDYLHQIQS